jgi:hypothetical protein
MKELRAGPERERLVEVARLYCAAETSADPDDTSALFVDSIRASMDEVSYGYRRSDSGEAGGGACAPERTWYRGGSRTFVDVRRGDRTERLDFWDGVWPAIFDVVYLEPRRIEGEKVKSLRQELLVLARAAPPAPVLPDRECVPEFYNFAFLETDTQVYRQGATVKLIPTFNMQPAGTRAMPVRCTSGWSVTGPATLSADRTSLTIAPDAPVGALVTVAFSHEGKPVRAQFKVIGKDELVLTGRYSQRAVEGCDIPDPVRELEFFPGDRFAVTFQPFETYRDYWGSFAFDQATGRIALKVEGGNSVPAGLDLEGEAKLESGALVLTGVFLGSRHGPPQQGCTYRF